MSELRAISIQPPMGWLVATGAASVVTVDSDTDHRGELALHLGGPWRLRDDHDPEIRRALGCACRVSLVATGARDCPWHGAGGGARNRLIEAQGAFVALAQLVDVHQADGCCGPWGEPGWHYELADVRLVGRPVQASGRRRGCWLVRDEHARVLRQPSLAVA